MGCEVGQRERGTERPGIADGEIGMRRCGRWEGTRKEGKRRGQRRPGSLLTRNLRDSAQPVAANRLASPASWPRPPGLSPIHQRVLLSEVGEGRALRHSQCQLGVGVVIARRGGEHI